VSLKAPTTPGSLAKSGSTQTSVSLAWSASSDDTGVTGYTVYRDGTSAGLNLFYYGFLKVLADMAVNDPAAFGSIVEKVKAQLA